MTDNHSPLGATLMPTALVIGTDHAFQRRQDLSAENEAIRDAFENLLQETFTERKTDGIAEEAGNDQSVWEYLRRLDAETPKELRVLFRGTEIVDSPQPTIARSIAEATGVHYADIRATEAENMSVAERDQAMAQAIHNIFANAESVVVIVGEAHRAEVERILHETYGWTTSSVHFP